MASTSRINTALAGARRFTSDFYQEHMLFGLTYRARIPHGRIANIAIPDPPEGITVVSSKDLKGKKALTLFGADMPILAYEEVKYYGEPILLACGEDERSIQDFFETISVEYEEKEPLYSIDDISPEQIAVQRTILHGEPDAAFETADRIIQGTYRTGLQEHLYPEPQGAVAVFSPHKMEIFTATQWPFHVLQTVSEVTGLPPERIFVKVQELGPALDGKLWFPSLVSAHAALLAMKTQKTVKMIYTREEDFLYSSKRSPSIIKQKTGLDKDGNIIATDIEVVFEGGAYPCLDSEILDRMCLGSAGITICDNIRIQGKAVLTNNPPMGAFRGLGIAQGAFSSQLHTLRLADELGFDPYSWLKKSLETRNGRFITGGVLKDDKGAKEVLDRVVSISDFNRKFVAYEMLRKRRGTLKKAGETLRGIGLSLGYQGNGLLGKGENRENYAVTVRLEKDGRLGIMTSGVTESSVPLHFWKLRAQEILGIPIEKIHIERPDTSIVPNSGPSTLSRNTTVITRLIERCCMTIQKRRFRDPLPIEVKSSSRLPRTFAWDHTNFEGLPFVSLSWAGVVTELELNTISREPRIRGLWICVDGGRIIDEDMARANIEADVLCSLGWIQHEDIVFENGRIPPEGFLSYKIPSLHAFPPFTLEFLPYDAKTQVKGIGELTLASLPASYLSALSQCLGKRVTVIPLNAFDEEEGEES